jgi:hypothetical protein
VGFDWNRLRRHGRGWLVLVAVSTVFLVLAAGHLVWALATGSLEAAVFDVAALALWYWIGMGALRRIRAAA